MNKFFPYLVLGVGLFPNAGDYFSTKWFLMLLVLGGVLALEVYKRFSLPLFLYWFYLLFYALFMVFMASKSPDPGFEVAREYAAARLLLPLLLLLALDSIEDETLKNTMGLLCVINGIYTCLMLPFDGVRFISGMTRNGSMNALITLCGMPFVDLRGKWQWLWVPVIFSLVICKTSLAAGGLIVMLGFGLWGRYKWKTLLLTLLCVPAYLYDKGLFNSTGRHEIWLRYWYFFKDNINPIVGGGPGIFYPLARPLSLELKTGDVWLWLHNDWFQILFEHGAIGLSLALLLAAYSLWRAREDMRVFSSLMIFVGAMGMYYPAHFPLQVFVGACLLKFTNKK